MLYLSEIFGIRILVLICIFAITLMISFLDGKIEFKAEKFIIVNVAGVGYKIFVSSETFNKIPEKGSIVNGSTGLTVDPEQSRKIKIWTHQYVREDSLELYGFLNFAELELFEILIGISGIGPKSALGILGVAPVDTLKKAIASGDTSYLTRVSGIGRKIAGKIVLELREKFAGKGVLSVDTTELKEEADALDALISLGYSQREAREALQLVPKEIVSAERRLKEALKKLGKQR